jgi:hypothetical protein
MMERNEALDTRAHGLELAQIELLSPSNRELSYQIEPNQIELFLSFLTTRWQRIRAWQAPELL